MISVEASQGVSLLRSAEEEDGHDHEAERGTAMTMGPRMLMRDGHDHGDEEDAAVTMRPRMKTMPPTTLLSPHRTVMTPTSTASTTHVWLDPMNANQEMQNICAAFF